ncbi:hypothetical protein [Paraburkholderia elongata]|uniref:Uncharacterized protein n=1 Tax=Paraburkholderia elongata TaxID=2675747 RepID=A0A972SL33_9BURK|nr:hypothetical protein [Paraburkholderia elongata]NPT57385.1 hypothetical protein [Paraburkholderia elongata]
MTASERRSALFGQMSALAGFMYCDGREAFNALPECARDELRTLFNSLNGELQEAIAGSRCHSQFGASTVQG